MYKFAIDPATPKPALYAALLNAAAAITDGEEDGIANMANVASLLWQHLPDLNWAGFYRMGKSKSGQNELVLGPFQGKAACIRIPLNKGVCGAAAHTGTAQCIDDVHDFAGHIACDADSRSELVVPVIRGGKVIAVIDLDSPLRARFDTADVAGITQLAELLSQRI